MAIYKEIIQKQYCRIPMEYLNNKDLTLKEKGLLSTLYGLPENWDFSVEGLAHTMQDGVNMIRSTFKSLVKKGYIRENQVRGPDGRFRGNDLQLYIQPSCSGNPSDEKPHVEKPNAEKPFSEKPFPECPNVENRQEYNNNESIIKESNNNRSIRADFPAVKSKVKAPAGTGRTKFHNFPERKYDIPALERALFQAQKYNTTNQKDNSAEQATDSSAVLSQKGGEIHEKTETIGRTAGCLTG